MIKAALDLKNNRGKSIEKIGQIAYYGAVQNAIFTTLQTAVFAAFGEDDDELWDSKTKRAKNQMVDSLLVGMGFTGVIAKTVKNSYLQWNTQRKKGHNADHARTILEFANMSPTIGSKLRKLYSATQTEKYNQDVIDEMGFDINSPAVNVMANVISATTNIPTDRAVQKVQNILLASKSETEVKDKIALVLGWNPWDLDIETEAKKIREEVKGKAGKRKKQENIIKKEKELQPTIEKEKEQEEKGTKTIFNCGAIRTDGTRCSNSVTKAGAKCTVHQEVKQRPSGKETKCKAKRTNGKPCNMMTTATSGFCVYHD
jgi:antitoxin component of RelBE/YafQ-DinJ toxin-antitoxin module